MGEVLGDAVIATAILDRLLHHSHVLNSAVRAIACGEEADRALQRQLSPAPRSA